MEWGYMVGVVLGLLLGTLLTAGVVWSFETRRMRLGYALSIILLLVVMSGNASAQHWKWTEPAEHHQAVVAVLAGNAGGTGVHIGQGWLLTAGHVAETQSGYVTFQNGNRYPWTRTGFRYNRYSSDVVDLAVLYAPQCAHEPFAYVAEQPPAHGETIELVGMGGPGPAGDGRGKALRHFAMRVLDETGHTRLVTDGVVTYGDSGAPCFNRLGQVVGIQSAGRHAIDKLVSYTHNGEPVEWDALTPALLTNVGPIRKLLGWTYQPQGCFGGSCPPQQGYAGGGGSGKAQGWYPPQSAPPPPQQAPAPQGPPQQSPPQQPPQQVQPQAPAAACDCEDLRCDLDALKKQVDQVAAAQLDQDEIAQVLADAIARQPDQFRGPPGVPGDRGPAGPPGKAAEMDVSAISQMVLDRLPPIHVQALGDDGQPIGPPATVQLGGKLNLKLPIVRE